MRATLVIAALVASTGVAHAEEVASLSSPPQAKPVEAPALAPSDRVEGGEHWRLETQNGSVHVWKPAGYQPRTAGTVIYLHGHRSTADSAWDEHQLAAQFKASGLNALFIVCDSTTDGEEALHWESPGALVREVARRTGVARPPGELVVMGHSGAYRNIGAWLQYAPLDHLILLDAMYDLGPEFLDWITRSRGHEHKRMTLVSRDTKRAAVRWMKLIPSSVGRIKIPDGYDGLSKREKGAQVLNIRSQYDHMAIVTSGRVIPVVLRRAAIPLIGEKAPPPAKKQPPALVEAAPLPPPASVEVVPPVPASEAGRAGTSTLRASPAAN